MSAEKSIERAGAQSPGIATPLLGQGPGGQRARVRWLVSLRMLAITGQMLVLLPAVELGWLASWYVTHYIALVGSLALLNLITWRKVRLHAETGPYAVLFHLVADLVVLTGLLSLTGGVWNPLAPLIFIHGLLGGLLLSRVQGAVHLVVLVGTLAILSFFPVTPLAMGPRWLQPAIVFPCFALVMTVIWGISGWLATTLTRHRRLLESLRANQERVDRLRVAGAMSAGFAHEFATPLNTMRMRLGRLARREEMEDDGDLQALEGAVLKMEGVLQKIGRRPVEPKDIKLEDVDLAQLVLRLAGSWPRGRKVECETEAVMMHLPSEAVSQALLNLLDNADDAMAENGVEAPIKVSVRHDGHHAILSVADRGPGWPQVVRDNVGQPFLTTKSDGTGLGLCNVHSLALALGGQFSLLDRPGGGAVAELRVPLDEEEWK